MMVHTNININRCLLAFYMILLDGRKVILLRPVQTIFESVVKILSHKANKLSRRYFKQLIKCCMKNATSRRLIRKRAFLITIVSYKIRVRMQVLCMDSKMMQQQTLPRTDSYQSLIRKINFTSTRDTLNQLVIH